MKTNKEDWLPKEGFEDGTVVDGWISSVKGFEDCVALIAYYKGEWVWEDGWERITRPDLIEGVRERPEPPVKYSNKDVDS